MYFMQIFLVQHTRKVCQKNNNKLVMYFQNMYYLKTEIKNKNARILKQVVHTLCSNQ